MLHNNQSKRTLARLALGVSSFAIMAAGSAYAQETIVTDRAPLQVPTQVAQATDAPPVLEEIVVTGFRKSLFDSVSAKKNSSQIVEAISSEDIGKLPDNSIAEALSRLPGIATQRVDGRAQSVSLRGLGPDFTTTLLNGREQVSTGNNRSVEYDQYASELLGQVLVYKTPQANIVGQGLAGTVDLRTVKPLSYNEPVLALSARGELLGSGKLNDDSDELGYRLSGAYIGQFADETIGVSIGVAHLRQPTQIKSMQNGYNGDQAPAGTQTLNEPRIEGRSTLLKRTGISGTVEFEPSESFKTSVDVFYSNFKEDQDLRGIQLPMAWAGGQGTLLQPGVTVEDGLVTAGEFVNVQGVVRGDNTTVDADLFSIGWNANYSTDGGWSLTADAGYSEVERESDILELWFGTGRPGSTPPAPRADIGFEAGSDFGWQFDTDFDYDDRDLFVLGNPQTWGSAGPNTSRPSDGFLKVNTVDDNLYTLRGEIAKEFDSPIRAVQVGVNYSAREKSYSVLEGWLSLAATATDNSATLPIPDGAFRGSTDLGFSGIGDLVAVDGRWLVDNGFYDFFRNTNQDVIQKDWTLEEDVTTFYTQGDLDWEVGDIVVTGNVGVQVVHTDQRSVGTALSGTNEAPIIAPYDDGISYTDILPSANIILNFPDDAHKVRIGLSRQIARARPDELTASFNYGFDPSDADYDPATNPNLEDSPWSGSGGNPKLKPWEANAVDVSYEYYFSGTGYVALAGFYKDLKTYIRRQDVEFDFTGLPLNGNPEPVTRLGLVTQPVNDEGGEIYGLEVALSLPFEVFADSLEGMGFTGNIGYTETKISPPSGAQALPGYSKWTPQGTVYYDKDGFSARVSVTHRSDYLAEVTGFGAQREFQFGKAETIVDAQVSYEFQDGTLDGLTVLLQGNNLTDEPFITYEGDDTRRVRRAEKFGARYLLGVSYKF